MGARWRAWALTGAAALALAPAVALAQPTPEFEDAADAFGLRGLQPLPPPAAPPAPKPAVSVAPGSDGLVSQETYLEANLVTDDSPNHTVTAQGAVEARHNGRTLRADEVVYDTTTGEVHAHGHVMVINPDGSVEYSNDVELDKDLSSGVATAFSARLAGNVTIAAGAAIRRTPEVYELRSAIYTPCDICKADGVTPKQPTWSIQATKVIEDKEHQVVYYRNAVIRIKGIPVLYSPIFWHPDPDSPRRSGLLAPKLRYANRLGMSYEQPYLWAISPYADLVISPIFTTEVNPFLNLEYRQRFYSGVLNARLGYTYEKLFDGQGRYGTATSRSYILADGKFQLSDNWYWGFGAERVSDPTLFARYGIENIYRQRGLFTTDTQRLISQIFTVRQNDTSYLSVSALNFQSLRVQQVGRTLVSLDPTNAFPTVGPLIEARIDPVEPVLGGHFRFLGSAVALTRNQDVAPTAAGQLQNQGVDSRRATAQVDWRRTFTFDNGMRAEPFVQARTDAYSISDPFAVTKHTTFARGLATVGADFSYPFIRQKGSSTIILEPLVQVAASPDYHLNPNVPNEDSVALEFDSTNLFSTNRFPGFDLYEGGRRANVGGRATFNWDGNHSASVLVGRSFRDQSNPAFYVGSGLEGLSSDWVTAVTLSPFKGLNLFSRSRLDGDTLRIRREEAGMDVNVFKVSASARYLYTEQDAAGVRSESISLSANTNITKHWGVSAVGVRDLNAGLWPLTSLTLYYHDECIRVDFIYTHDQTFASTIVPSNSLQVRLTLATLGGQGR
ncbi:MAG TPA: LPS assembly protein LptD [Caulobacteraceae bacterium]|jgi:LPS-assembly protein|nr:LPS assembly protein LptD [Caulobacteraceae bacterium]